MTTSDFYQKIPDDDFVAVELTDQQIIPNVMNRLREYYPRIISFKRQNGRMEIEQEKQREIKQQSPIELLQDFFEDTTGHGLSTAQLKFASEILTKVERSDE